MLKTVHCPTESACTNVRRVSARPRHFAPFTRAPHRKRELAACECFVYSIRRCSVIISIAGWLTSHSCYHNGNKALSFFSGGCNCKWYVFVTVVALYVRRVVYVQLTDCLCELL